MNFAPHTRCASRDESIRKIAPESLALRGSPLPPFREGQAGIDRTFSSRARRPQSLKSVCREAKIPAGHFMDVKQTLNRLTRSDTDRMIGGVCGGIAEATEIPAWVCRAAFVFLLLAFGTGVLLYLVLWFFMPPQSHLT
jgi:phage shock protein C